MAKLSKGRYPDYTAAQRLYKAVAGGMNRRKMNLFGLSCLWRVLPAFGNAPIGMYDAAFALPVISDTMGLIWDCAVAGPRPSRRCRPVTDASRFAVMSARRLWRALQYPDQSFTNTQTRHLPSVEQPRPPFIYEPYYAAVCGYEHLAASMVLTKWFACERIGLAAEAFAWAYGLMNVPEKDRRRCEEQDEDLSLPGFEFMGRQASVEDDAQRSMFSCYEFGPPGPSWGPDWTNNSAFRWNDGCVVKMAVEIAECCQLSRLPILADALEDGGCALAPLLFHLRKLSPHGVGCWALSYLTGAAGDPDIQPKKW